MITNDFSIHVASANGTGSQSSNLAIMRGIFNMGVPVVAKNFFPSNIQGLPTWYNLRVTKDDYRCRKDGTEILVCMNQETVQDDLTKADPGCVCFVRDKLVYSCDRKDIEVIPFPADALIKEVDAGKLRKLVVNFIYVGVLQEYLGIDRDAIEAGLSKVFGGKPKAVGLNMAAVDKGAEWARENLKDLEKKYAVEAMDLTRDRFIIEGNDAAALGTMFAGCTFISWYPITPSSSLCESAIGHYAQHRVTDDGKKTYAIVQAEDELASLGMVLAASWAGARSMTATSGPGISLMSEFVGLGFFTETPAVIVDVQRMGPSTGLPTRTCQGDIQSTYYLSHGDARHPLVFPATPEESFSLMVETFDLADKLQTPIFFMLDLDLGMNNWMATDFDYPEAPIDRGKLIGDEELAKMDYFGRYADVDGDAIPYRTGPGVKDPKGAWFARGTGHTPAATYSEDPDNYRENMDRLSRKFETARAMMPQPMIRNNPKATIGFIAYGTSHQAVEEVLCKAEDLDVEIDYMRIRAIPFELDTLRNFVERFDKVYVIEQNRDGQMLEILASWTPDLATRYKSVPTYDGLPLSADLIIRNVDELKSLEV